MKLPSLNLSQWMTVIGGAIIIALLASGGVLVYKYVNAEKDLKTYQATVKANIKTSKSLNTQIDALKAQVAQYLQSKEDTLAKMGVKDKQIKELENKIYAQNNQLIIPSDYDGLKTSYTQLSSLYQDKTDLYDKALNLVTQDTTIIKELNTKLGASEDANKQLVKDLEDAKKATIPFYQQGVLAGVGIKTDGTIAYSLAYEGIILGHIQFVVMGQYPLEAMFMIGFKF